MKTTFAKVELNQTFLWSGYLFVRLAFPSKYEDGRWAVALCLDTGTPYSFDDSIIVTIL